MGMSDTTHHLDWILENGYSQGILLGFVVNSGCNMKEVAGRHCAHCAITQRNERNLPVRLSGEDFVKALRDVATRNGMYDHGNLLGFSVCGDETLNDDEVFYQRSLPLLQEAQNLGTRRSLVTNGFNLSKYMHELAQTDCFITVRLDGVGADNDRTRGGYDRVIENLEQAAPVLGEKLSIGSVLYPGREQQLEPLLEILVRYNITRWMITPLIDFGRQRCTKLTAENKQFLDRLGKAATRHGIQVLLEYHVDESLWLDYVTTVIKPRHVHVVRLTFNGTVNAADSIFVPKDVQERLWNPQNCFMQFCSQEILLHRDMSGCMPGSVFTPAKQPFLVPSLQ